MDLTALQSQQHVMCVAAAVQEKIASVAFLGAYGFQKSALKFKLGDVPGDPGWVGKDQEVHERSSKLLWIPVALTVGVFIFGSLGSGVLGPSWSRLWGPSPGLDFFPWIPWP